MLLMISEIINWFPAFNRLGDLLRKKRGGFYSLSCIKLFNTLFCILVFLLFFLINPTIQSFIMFANNLPRKICEFPDLQNLRIYFYWFSTKQIIGSIIINKWINCNEAVSRLSNIIAFSFFFFLFLIDYCSAPINTCGFFHFDYFHYVEIYWIDARLVIHKLKWWNYELKLI